MRPMIRVRCVCAASCLAFVLASAPASAAPKTITGELTKSGYTVIALAASGKASSAQVGRGGFRLRPVAERVTLHLRARSGRYAGPIVVEQTKRGKVAILGVMAGAKLGSVKVRRGYAKVAKRLPKKRVDTTRRARARKGVPIGARRFGRVRSTRTGGGAPGDRDLDGIPDRLDIDDDGDRVLDKVDRSRLRRGRLAAVTAEDPLGLATGLAGPLSMTANVHTGASDATIDQVSRDLGYINMDIPFGVSAVELDCGPPLPAGLSYCALGGTAVLDNGKPFPECCDGDGDDFGLMVPTESVPGDFQGFGFDHRSTSTEIVTGKQIFHHVTKSGDESQCPSDTDPDCVSYSAVQQFAFATMPALKSFDDGAGPRVTIPYPVDRNGPGNTANHPLPVAARGGDVILDVTVWRPQRRPTSDAECGVPGCALTDWRDMGGLVHYATGGPSNRHYASFCPKEGAYSDPSAGLEAFEPDPGAGGFLDTTATRAADPANTLSYRLNLTKCLEPEGISFGVNQTRAFAFQVTTPTSPEQGVTGADGAHQIIYFQRTG